MRLSTRKPLQRKLSALDQSFLRARRRLGLLDADPESIDFRYFAAVLAWLHSEVFWQEFERRGSAAEVSSFYRNWPSIAAAASGLGDGAAAGGFAASPPATHLESSLFRLGFSNRARASYGFWTVRKACQQLIDQTGLGTQHTEAALWRHLSSISSDVDKHVHLLAMETIHAAMELDIDLDGYAIREFSTINSFHDRPLQHWETPFGAFALDHAASEFRFLGSLTKGDSVGTTGQAFSASIADRFDDHLEHIAYLMTSPTRGLEGASPIAALKATISVASWCAPYVADAYDRLVGNRAQRRLGIDSSSEDGANATEPASNAILYGTMGCMFMLTSTFGCAPLDFRS